MRAALDFGGGDDKVIDLKILDNGFVWGPIVRVRQQVEFFLVQCRNDLQALRFALLGRNLMRKNWIEESGVGLD